MNQPESTSFIVIDHLKSVVIQLEKLNTGLSTFQTLYVDKTDVLIARNDTIITSLTTVTDTIISNFAGLSEQLHNMFTVMFPIVSAIRDKIDATNTRIDSTNDKLSGTLTITTGTLGSVVVSNSILHPALSVVGI